MWREACDESEKTLKRAIELLERTSGHYAEDTANAVGSLGLLYRQMDRLPQAEQRQREELEIRERLYGPVHHRVALSLDQLAGDRKSTRLNSSHQSTSRMPSSA